MAGKLRFDYPQEVVQERKEVYDKIFDLLAEDTPDAWREANGLHLRWLERFPEDAIALDAGEVLAKCLDTGSEDVEAMPALAATTS